MRNTRLLIAQEKTQVNQYAKELINSTGIITYSEMTGEAQKYTYKRHRFCISLSSPTIGKTENPDTISIITRAACLMSQIVHGDIEPCIKLVLGSTKYMPLSVVH